MRLFLLLLIISFALQWVLPWWILAIVAFALAFWLANRAAGAFWAGFGGISAGWLVLSLFFHLRNDGLLTSRVATLFTLPQPWLLLVVTAVVGGLVGGGGCFNRVFLPAGLGLIIGCLCRHHSGRYRFIYQECLSINPAAKPPESTVS